MSDTPRTDAFENLTERPINWWDFARELERENAALRISVNRLRRALLDCSDAAIGGSTLAMWIRGKVTATLSKEDGS